MVKAGSNSSKPTTVKSAGKASAKYSKSSTSGGELKPVLENILQAMGKLRAVGKNKPKRTFVQNFSGNAKTKAGFEKNLGILRKQGYLEYPDGQTVTLTDKGIKHVGEVDPSSITNETMHKSMKEMLTPKARNIFDALADGKLHVREKVAKELGYDMEKLSGYEKDISKMKTLGFVECPSKTTFQLTDDCFPLDRPATN